MVLKSWDTIYIYDSIVCPLPPYAMVDCVDVTTAKRHVCFTATEQHAGGQGFYVKPSSTVRNVNPVFSPVRLTSDSTYRSTGPRRLCRWIQPLVVQQFVLDLWVLRHS